MNQLSVQIERAHLLKTLHVKGDPLIVFNIWDAGSAKVVQEIGAKVIATGSWSVAAAHGYDDREKLTLDLALANLRRIVGSVRLPVTLDFEAGYGKTPAEVQANVARVMEAGAVGVNFEDQVIGGDGLFSIEDQCERIHAIRKAADNAKIPIFLNARTDVFLKNKVENHNDEHLEEALKRAFAFAESGASGFFVPGLRNAQYIEEICRRSPLPVNLLVMSGTPSPGQLAKLGVARISYGPAPYRVLMDALKAAGRKALSMEE